MIDTLTVDPKYQDFKILNGLNPRLYTPSSNPHKKKERDMKKTCTSSVTHVKSIPYNRKPGEGE